MLIFKDYNQGYHFWILLNYNVYGYGLKISIKTGLRLWFKKSVCL